MSTARIEALVWVLIYAGMLTGALGLAVQPRDPGLGWSLASAGAALVFAGIVLVWVRSRMKSER